MKTSIFYVLLLPLVLVFGCVTTEQLDARLHTWVGHEADQLVAEWGAPKGTYQNKDGTRTLTYDRMGIISTGSTLSGFGGQTFSRYCRVDFVADKDGKIANASWHGAADQCDRSIAAFGNGAPSIGDD